MPDSAVRGRSVEAAAYRLFHMLSPTFPVGAFSYSHGLESAVERGSINGRATAHAWLQALLNHGSLGSDALLLARTRAAAVTGDGLQVRELAELAAALPGSAELTLEALAQGRAFLKIWSDTWGADHGDRARGWLDGIAPALPVAAGIAAGIDHLPARLTLVTYLGAATANLTSALVRLGPLGQTDGQALLVALEPDIHSAAERVADAPVTAIGVATPLHDIMSMRHETQYTRLFRS